VKTTFQIKGLATALNKVNAALADVQGKTTAGLLEAGLLVQGRAQKKVPVEYGVLRASAFTRKALKANKATGVAGEVGTVIVGFGAAYALYVHENLEQKLKGEPRKSGKGVYWGPDGEPKFLENALRRSNGDILKIVQKRAKIRGGKK
jgi:hypothetical protein